MGRLIGLTDGETVPVEPESGAPRWQVETVYMALGSGGRILPPLATSCWLQQRDPNFISLEDLILNSVVGHRPQTNTYCDVKCKRIYCYRKISIRLLPADYEPRN